MTKQAKDFKVGCFYTNAHWQNPYVLDHQLQLMMFAEPNDDTQVGCMAKEEIFLVLRVVNELWLEVLGRSRSGFVFLHSMSEDTRELVL